MKQIETRLPLRPRDIIKGSQLYLDKLSYLIKNPDFYEQVISTRERFNLPAYGIKRDLSDNKKFAKVMSLTLDAVALKSLKVRRKSRKNEFQTSVTKILQEFDLPERFREALTKYVMYNRLPHTSPHLPKCLIRIFADKGEARIFVEVFGDTKKQDIIKAWKDVEIIKRKYKARGEHLSKYGGYYKHKLISSGKSPVDKAGYPVNDDSINNLNYFEKNIYKSRHKAYMKRNNSK